MHINFRFPNIKSRQDVKIKSSSKIGLVMKTEAKNKYNFKDILPSWLEPITFQPLGSRNSTIEISDFYRTSDKLQIKNKYFSTNNSKVRDTFRECEEKNHLMHNQNIFRGIISLPSLRIAKPSNSGNSKGLKELLKIKSLHKKK